MNFEDDSAPASSVYYLSFVTLTSTGYGDIIPVHPLARIVQCRERDRPALPGHAAGEARYARTERPGLIKACISRCEPGSRYFGLRATEPRSLGTNRPIAFKFSDVDWVPDGRDRSWHPGA
ncbi:potassium channel family protein [Bradyrhizobium sp. USDA 4516]